MFKRIINIITQAVANTTALTFSKSIGVGTWNGLLIGCKTGTLHDSDTITVTVRDNKGAKPIVQNMTVGVLRKISDLLKATADSTHNFYLPIGCVALGNGTELDIQYNRNASGNAGTIYISGVLIREQFEHIKQYITVTGDDIVGKDISQLYITNAGSYPDATIEVQFVNGRSHFCSVQELIHASQVFGNNLASLTDVISVYQNTGLLNEIEYIRPSDANIAFIYVTDLVDGQNVLKPVQEAINFNQVVNQKNATNRPDKFKAIRNAVTQTVAVKNNSVNLA